MASKCNNTIPTHLVTISPVDLERFHILVNSNFFLEIKLNNFYCSVNISQRDQKYLILYSILRSWGLVLPISHLSKKALKLN